MQQFDNTIYQQLPAIVRRYQQTDNRKAAIQILNSFLPFVAIWTAMYLLRDVSVWLTIWLAVAAAFFLVRIFIIQHDCGHQSFTAFRKANNIIGAACSFLTFIPYKYWAKNHNYHHGHNGILDENRDIGDINTLTVKEFCEYRRRSSGIIFGLPSRAVRTTNCHACFTGFRATSVITTFTISARWYRTTNSPGVTTKTRFLTKWPTP